MVRRFDVFLVSLDPTQGREIKKTRPCVIVSPDEFSFLDTYIIAPMTTKKKDYPTRVNVKFMNKQGYIALDQIRTIDRARLVKRLGVVDKKTGSAILKVLREIFES